MEIAKVEDFFNQYGGYTREEMLERAKEFAKAHTRAALEAALKNGKACNGGTYNNGECLASNPAYIEKESILSAYPLTNIK